MIKYNLACKCGETFESWFSSSSEFDYLCKKKLIKCIYCESSSVKKTGSDITIVATGGLVKKALDCVDILEKEGISIEVIDPRTLNPLDTNTIGKSIQKTNHLIIFDDTNRTCGYGAELYASLGELYWNYFNKPIKRICRADVPVPYSPILEDAVLPNSNDLIEECKKMIQKRSIERTLFMQF